MGTRISAVIIEAEQSAAKYLGALLDKTCQIAVIGNAIHGETGICLCDELRPEAVFLDINLPGIDGVSLAGQLKTLPQSPRLVFTTSDPHRAVDAFRLAAVDYLLKPLDPTQVSEAVTRLAAVLRPFEAVWVSHQARFPVNGELHVGATQSELLPVKDVDNDMIRLLSRREIAAVLRKGRRTWIHTVREEFSTYYPLASLLRWLGGRPFIQIGRHAVVNERAIERVTRLGSRLYGVQLRDRPGTDIIASHTGAVRLAAGLEFNSLGPRRESSN